MAPRRPPGGEPRLGELISQNKASRLDGSINSGTWLSWNGKRVHLESVKHRKRSKSSESSKNVKSGIGSITRSSKARAARAARASTQQASSIAWGPCATIENACASLLCFPMLWRVLLCVALWSWFVFRRSGVHSCSVLLPGASLARFGFVALVSFSFPLL